MASRSRVAPGEIAARATTAVKSRLRGWLADPVAAQADSLSIGLHPPSERLVATNPDDARDWARSWQAYRGAGTVDWESRRWPSFGTQDIPVRLRLDGAAAIFRAAGQSSRWTQLQVRRDGLGALYSGDDFTAAVASTVNQWEPLSANDFERLTATMSWLLANPDSGLLIRQLPIPGVDTKWLGSNRRLVERLVEGARGTRDLGIRTLPSLREIVILDEAILPGMPRGLATTLEGLAELKIAPSTVLILENREGVHALGPIPGTVAVFGGGNSATDLASIGWITKADVVYWGDLDTHGFTLLDRVRRRLPRVRSVLMDGATLDRWESLCVVEPSPSEEDPTDLTEAEYDVLLRLRSGHLRLEQERIPWPYVLTQLAAAGLPVTPPTD